MDDGSDSGQLTKKLTRRQAQVIGLAAGGMSDKEIARHLGLSRRTVQDHFGAARNRWGAAIRAELIAMAVATGSTQPTTDSRSETGEFANKIILPRPPAELPRPPAAVHGPPAGGRRASGPEPGRHRPGRHGPERRRPGRPTVMTPERIAAARELLRDHTVTEVARKLGVGRTTLHQHMAVITATGPG